MTVIFDFDNTLFDTEAFKHASAEAVAAFGPDEARYQEAYRETVERSGRPCGYDPDTHLTLLKDAFATEADRTAAREAMDRIIGRCAEFVFPGALEALERLRDRGVRIVLLTVGTEWWQRKKIANTGLDQAFDMVRIVERDKLPVLKELNDGGAVVVVNDNGEEVDAMYAAFPDFHYVVKRAARPLPELASAKVCETFDEVDTAVRGLLSLD